MKLLNRQVENQPKLMIIPMIDIMFFLLVFFMISTMYMVQQHTIPINLPQAKTAQTDMHQTIAITVKENGDVLFDQETIPNELLPKRLSIALQQDPETKFSLRGDKDVPYNKIVNVLDTLKESGAQKVSVAVQKMR